MQIDFIRRDTPEEISEEGGAFIQIVNKDTLGLNTSIDEAKSALYVVGANSMIEGYFVGLMCSIFEGIKEDGHPRTIGDITIYPVCGGTFDLDKGWDPLVNDVRIKARLGSGITLDIMNWTFRDVTTGRVTYSIDTISDGTVTGQVSTDQDALLNGRNFPSKDLLTVSWVCGEKSGTVDATKFTANVARITIDKSAFSSLASTDNGKEIVFTVKGCYNKATAKAVLKYVKPTVTKTMTIVNSGGLVPRNGDTFLGGSGATTEDNLETSMFTVKAYDKTTAVQRTVNLSETEYGFAEIVPDGIRLACPGETENPWGSWVDYTKNIEIDLTYENAAAVNVCHVSAEFAES